eukprot:gnl/MRDRNA2_/MRDRNA2_110345_c0_seq1.p2 gnl/MRDRNA2_/MRDRNA2_110345_c0~~gnl/MRDRNA2_/MRDRNA2_110345_c0_seq1.p2  ORF type:complete len:103 (-),score=10.19 gnl/MRDRNA2_/MRDRNA2_110345_c0_seq1:546-854(-)
MRYGNRHPGMSFQGISSQVCSSDLKSGSSVELLFAGYMSEHLSLQALSKALQRIHGLEVGKDSVELLTSADAMSGLVSFQRFYETLVKSETGESRCPCLSKL